MAAKPKQGQTAKRLAQVQKDLKGVRFAWDEARGQHYIVSPYSGDKHYVWHRRIDERMIVYCSCRALGPCWHGAKYLTDEPWKHEGGLGPNETSTPFELNLPDGPVRWTGHGAEWESIESPSRGRSQLYREG